MTDKKPKKPEKAEKPEKKKEKKEHKRTIDPAAEEILKLADEKGVLTSFVRAEGMKPCPIGASGACCRNCFMGPCRLVGKDAEEKTGVCGATLGTVTARNLARSIAAGAAAHSDHGRDLASTLLAVAKGEACDYGVKDEEKLKKMADLMEIKTEDRKIEEVALDVATEALANFTRQNGELTYISRAPKKRQELWRKLGLVPRGVDREIVEMMHRTNMGVDQDPEHILDQALRTGLADGWGGSMLATDISDVLFGTPGALSAKTNLGVLKEDEVNVVVHGHEPLLSEMIVQAASDKELVQYAKSKGAKGINLAGICCTANEVLMRHGIPPAGNFLHQELAIVTGAVDAMVVDVQCIMESLADISSHYHTKLITTSRKAKVSGATHIEFDEHKALEVAKKIIKTAIDNFKNRGEDIHIPAEDKSLIAGFSHEYINYMLGGKYRASFRPLNDNIMNGRIQGAVAIVGCNNPRVCQDQSHRYLIEEFIKRDVLVLQTGCGAHAGAKYGFLTPEAALELAGPGLKEVCEAVGIPPVLHVGSCVDNSRILTITSHMVAEGGLGDDVSDLPIAAIAPEWMSEKALAIAAYAVASGAYVIFGVGSPVAASKETTDILLDKWEKKLGGKLEFETDLNQMVEKAYQHIQKKRKALKIDTAKERVLYDMEMRRELEV